ncbi:hypothetical protein Zmor_024269 [Zophobas morio]|uniref:Peptidase C1A papain C-terminal domain-containing protein n=1 Tax=Zophobas morio TaxID=2755281 RepID=A0AA38HY89_9CUCU|nr:hypothetical protein Zmor_024269 [Zophobas morio]
MSGSQFNVSFALILFLIHSIICQYEEPPPTFSGGVLFSVNEQNELKGLSDAKIISHPQQSVPENFNAKDEWPECESIQTIRDEGDCGFSWALALTQVVTDRLCIATNGTITFQYSAEDLLTCCPDCHGSELGNICEAGGNLVRALKFLQEEGVVSGGDMVSNKGCRPTSAATLVRSLWTRAPIICKTACSDEYNDTYQNDKRHIYEITYDYSLNDTKKIQTEIMTNGPVMAVIRPTETFRENAAEAIDGFPIDGNYPEYDRGNSYRSGYYHGVRICGWGKKDGKTFWIASNSWGSGWGDGGYFKYGICQSYL